MPKSGYSCRSGTDSAQDENHNIPYVPGRIRKPMIKIVVSAVKCNEEEGVLPWHFPMTEPKSSLTDLRKKRFTEG